jgi:hypothetical protein
MSAVRGWRMFPARFPRRILLALAECDTFPPPAPVRSYAEFAASRNEGIEALTVSDRKTA